MKSWLFLLFFISSRSIAEEIIVNQMNNRFMSITASTKYMKIFLSKPRDEMAIFSIEIKTPTKEFSFVSRRAVPWDEAIGRVLELRKFIKTHRTAEVIGNSASKDKKNSYYSMWEIIRSKNECVGYFGQCENFESVNIQFADFKKNPIDPKIYP